MQMTDGLLQPCRRWERKLEVRGQYIDADVLVDESTDERSTVFGVLPREELVGALREMVVKLPFENPELRTYCQAMSISKVGTKKEAVDVEIKSKNLQLV